MTGLDPVTRMSQTKDQRLHALDGLRGIAALLVAISHSYYVFSIDGVRDIWNYTLFTAPTVSTFITRLILTIANGQVAVVTFFLLSGFVLGRSLEKTGMDFSMIIKFYIR